MKAKAQPYPAVPSLWLPGTSGSLAAPTPAPALVGNIMGGEGSPWQHPTAGPGGTPSPPSRALCLDPPGLQLWAGGRSQPMPLSREGARLLAEPGLEPHFSPPIYCINALLPQRDAHVLSYPWAEALIGPTGPAAGKGFGLSRQRGRSEREDYSNK